MESREDKYEEILAVAKKNKATLIAVSKTKPNEAILELYNRGQRFFGENKVQELCEKQESLPKDILWHIIGHLQKNKVKYIAPFVSLIHAVDSIELLKVIQKEAAKNERIIPVLLQIYIASEETKFGLSSEEVIALMDEVTVNPLPNVAIVGLMGMATFTTDMNQVSTEFASLKQIFSTIKEKYFDSNSLANHGYEFKEISMGMSGDYPVALAEGSTMIRIGSALFGAR